MELWLKNNQLVYQEDWERLVEDLHQKSTISKKAKKVLVENLKKTFLSAMKKRVPKKHFGIFLSGGIDSTLISYVAQELGAKFTCYTVGYETDSKTQDVIYSRKAFEMYHFDWKLKLYNLEEIEVFLKKAALFLKKVGLTDPIHVSIAAVIIAAVELAQKDSVTTFIGGLGAEEIFAGYQRHVVAKNVEAECWRGLKSMWATDLLRDATLGKNLGIDVVTPFLDKELIEEAMSVPGKYRVKNGVRKMILRDVALSFGLDKSFSMRKKQAAQYGSGFDKALLKLAKQKNLNKKEYVLSLTR